MLLKRILLILSATLFCSQATAQELQRYSFSEPHMGTEFRLILYSDNEQRAKTAADSAFSRVEELNRIMSDYLDGSELNRLSRTSGSGEFVKVSPDLFEVLQASVEYCRQSDGLFDITVGPLSRFWRVIRMSPEPALPGEVELEQILEAVGCGLIELNSSDQSVMLKASDMRLDLGGIAKGYTADEVLEVLKSFGITRALMDAGGDITLGDPPPGRSHWEVAVPDRSLGSETGGYITIETENRSVTTSGDLYQYVVIDGVRYSHVINPKSGIGSMKQIQATVVAGSGMQADALSSILTLMDPEEGMAMINRMDRTEAILFVNREGSVEMLISDGANALLGDLK
jgi:thiamine biosynthesis lipoprotein